MDGCSATTAIKSGGQVSEEVAVEATSEDKNQKPTFNVGF